MADARRASTRLKLWISEEVLEAATRRAAAESTPAKTVYVSDVARTALFGVAAQEGEAQQHIQLREASDRKRWPLVVQTVAYNQAKDRLRARGLSVAAVVEDGLIRYVQEEGQQS